jgi:hypothetical protein
MKRDDNFLKSATDRGRKSTVVDVSVNLCY